jgi:ketosteroid isomerase-like protein
MSSRVAFLCLIALAIELVACVAAPPRMDREQARREVESTERAFAKTMAERNFAAFSTFLADEAIFFNAAQPLRGKAQIAAAWKKFFDAPAAPFSWEPTQIEALDSATLAWSTGPVRDPSGRCIATFNSIWRREAPGIWRIVFDKGSEGCGDGK